MHADSALTVSQPLPYDLLSQVVSGDIVTAPAPVPAPVADATVATPAPAPAVEATTSLLATVPTQAMHDEVTAKLSAGARTRLESGQSLFFYQYAGGCAIPVGYADVKLCATEQGLQSNGDFRGQLTTRFGADKAQSLLAGGYTQLRNTAAQVNAASPFTVESLTTSVYTLTAPVLASRAEATATGQRIARGTAADAVATPRIARGGAVHVAETTPVVAKAEPAKAPCPKEAAAAQRAAEAAKVKSGSAFERNAKAVTGQSAAAASETSVSSIDWKKTAELLAAVALALSLVALGGAFALRRRFSNDPEKLREIANNIEANNQARAEAKAEKEAARDAKNAEAAAAAEAKNAEHQAQYLAEADHLAKLPADDMELAVQSALGMKKAEAAIEATTQELTNEFGEDGFNNPAHLRYSALANVIAMDPKVRKKALKMYPVNGAETVAAEGEPKVGFGQRVKAYFAGWKTRKDGMRTPEEQKAETTAFTQALRDDDDAALAERPDKLPHFRPLGSTGKPEVN